MICRMPASVILWYGAATARVSTNPSVPPNALQLGWQGDRGTSLSATVTGLPADGSTLYVRLGSLINATWQYHDYTYTAVTSTTSNAPAQMTTPAPGSTLAATTVQFQWNGGTGVSQFWLHVGTTAGGKDLYNQGQGTGLNATVPVCVDHMRDRQPLAPGTLDEYFGRVRRVDQNALSGVPVAEHVAEVPVAAGTDLFEDKLHIRALPPHSAVALI
jgi:hypothetical protein